ncbi:MAG TPA: FemAB family XrtA/PEP-CTERM system-associated protein [Vicinamibacterales bacterium]|nr:FemAB family XrtA/PEP-CTERM system-associated protein [Vicinamibacterales bacterium]
MADALVERTEPAMTAAESAAVVTLAGDGDRAAWETYVSRQASATGYHDWAWREVIGRTFRHASFYLIARRAGRADISGVLPLVEIRSRLFGRTMTSLPFVNYGGVLADMEEDAQALLAHAGDLARSRGCRHVELRHFDRRFDALPFKQHKVTMRLPLAEGIWDRLDRKVRNQIRKAVKSDLTVERGGVELLADFYAVFARNMRDLGTPVYTRRLFEEVLRAFPDRTRLVIVRLKGAPIAGGLTFRTGAMVEVPWASSINDYNALCPNHLLYWSVIEAAVAEGCRTLDFGRSTPNEGTYKFKAQWGATPVALHWEYCLLRGGAIPDQSPKNPRLRVFVDTWKRLPLWAANLIGPHVVRYIP